MSRRRKPTGTIIIPSQWTIYDLYISAEELKEYRNASGIPDGVLMESLVAIDKAVRRVITGFHASESIELPDESDDDGDFLGGSDAFAD